MWCQTLDILLKKEHLTKAGLLKRIALKSHFKQGLSDKLRTYFPNFTLIDKPTYSPNLSLINIFLIAGFYNVDSSFYMFTALNSNRKWGVKVFYGIDLTQDQISYIILESILFFDLVKFIVRVR